MSSINTNTKPKFNFNTDCLKLTPEKLVEWSNKTNQTTDNDSSLLQPFKKKMLTNEPRHLSIKKDHKTPQNSKNDSDSDTDDHDHDTYSNDVINASNEEKSN